ncbi:MAG: MerR family transcriptional regulator [Flavobacteriales bacterium]|jgi:DNA-binding transcriptional MerR regulator
MPFNKSIEKRYFTITEVSEQLGLNASQLRYWEKEFTPLKPRTNARGKRFYTANDVEIIQQIAWLVKDQGYTIDGARRAMKKRSEVAAAMASEQAAVQAADALDKQALLNRLRAVRAQLAAWEERLG